MKVLQTPGSVVRLQRFLCAVVVPHQTTEATSLLEACGTGVGKPSDASAGSTSLAPNKCCKHAKRTHEQSDFLHRHVACEGTKAFSGTQKKKSQAIGGKHESNEVVKGHSPQRRRGDQDTKAGSNLLHLHLLRWHHDDYRWIHHGGVRSGDNRMLQFVVNLGGHAAASTPTCYLSSIISK
jgi:hypothetical protein